MRIALSASVAAILVVVGFLTVARVGEDGDLLAWNATEGVLEVPPAGFHLLPRWSWKRSDASTLTARIAARSQEGLDVAALVRWNPVSGTYRLRPAVQVKEGLRAAIQAAVEEALHDVGIDCAIDQQSARTQGGSCPEDLGEAVSAAVARAVGSSEARVKTTLEVLPQTVRRRFIERIREELPEQEGKVLLLGLDGLDWDLVLPWIRGGRMPNLDRLMKAGTWGTMETIVPTLSPLIWTSMATGVTPDRHGILDFVEKDPVRGVMVPVTGRSRRVPAIWNIASAFGRSVAVVGWWGSWPAERIDGLMVSDRLYYTLTKGLTKEVLREEPPQMIFPKERREEFIELRNRAVHETDWPAVRYFMEVDERTFDAAVAADKGMDDPVDGFRRLLAATRTYMGAGLIAAQEKPDLVMVYLEGTDTIGHLLAPYVPPPTLEVDAAEAARYVAAIPAYFEIVDRWIGRYLEHYPPDEYAVIVVSDHGFKWSEDRPRGLSGTAGPTAAFWHDPDAAFVVSGRGARRLGRVAGSASIYDVAPTIAAMLGLPPGEGWRKTVLPGTPQAELEPIDYLQLVPPGSYRQDTGDVAPVDPEFISKLGALGYLSGGSGEAAPRRSTAAAGPVVPDPVTPAAAAEIDPTTTRGELNNLGLVKLGDKRFDEAEDLFRRAIAESPSYSAPHYNLRRLYLETGRYDEADRELWMAIDKGLRDPERTIDRAAADYENLDMQGRAVTLLEEGLGRYPEHEPFWVHLMVASVRFGECQRGVELGPEAARKFPDSAPVHAFYGLSAACVGDVATARSQLERSLELNPNQETLRRTLAQLQ